MKRIILSLMMLVCGWVSSGRSQAKGTPLDPFIRWEIQQIARMDSLWVHESQPYFREEQEDLQDSIMNRAIQHRADLMLTLVAIDTLLYSDLDNAAMAGWYEGAMDDLLNTIYQMVVKDLTNEQKAILKADEKLWLKKRDAHIKQQRRWQDKNPGTMFVQIASGNIGDFVRKRVLFLAAKLKD